MNIREATSDDASAIARVHVDSWRSAYRGLVPDDRLAKLDYAQIATRFRESIVTGSEYIYVAEKVGDVIGFLALGCCRDSDICQKTNGEVYAMYLLPGHWRKGNGRIMCQEADLILKSQAYSQAVLWVFEENEQARRFYEAMGFAADGATKIWNMGAPLNVVRYAKII